MSDRLKIPLTPPRQGQEYHSRENRDRAWKFSPHQALLLVLVTQESILLASFNQLEDFTAGLVLL